MAHPGDLREAGKQIVTFFQSTINGVGVVVEQYGDIEEHEGGEAAEGGVGEVDEAGNGGEVDKW